MKVKLNPMFDQVSGQLGGVVFREINGKTVASRKPAFTSEATVSQAAQRTRFKQAVEYGKSVMADVDTRAIYEGIADSRNTSVFAVIVADFLNAPVIDSVDLSAYTGQPGELINIRAHDDFGVTAVRVSILDGSGNSIESGNAVAGAGGWSYTATEGVIPGTLVNVHVVAADRPGGIGVIEASKTL